jgi:hypothetical protein
MTDAERIIKYIDIDLTEVERKTFESDLRTNESLKYQYDQYLSVNKLVDSARHLEKLNPIYTGTIIPRLRERLNYAGKPFLSQKLSLAYSIILVLVIGYFLFKPEFGGETDTVLSIQEIEENMNETDFNELVQFINGDNGNYNYSLEYLDTDLSNLEELLIQIPEPDDRLLTEFELNDIYAEISEPEADVIVQTFAHKNF